MSLRWKIAQFFEILWWKRYLKNRNPEEYLVWKRKYWNDLLDKIGARPDIQKSVSIMDSGCGPAGVFIVLDDKEVHAVDPLLDEYDKSLEQFSYANYQAINFYTCSFESYNGPKVDLIFCFNAVNHFRDLAKSIQLLRDCLNESGVLYISVDAHRFSLLQFIFNLIPGDILHPHQLTLGQYINRIEQVGLKVTETTLLKRESIFDYQMLKCHIQK